MVSPITTPNVQLPASFTTPPSTNSLFLLLIVLLLPLTTTLYLIITSSRAELSHIPGPFLARYTDAWSLFQAWKIVRWGGKVAFYQDLQAQYGDVVRVGPRSVMVLDSAAVPVIYGVRARLDKGPAYIPLRQPGVKASLVSIRDEKTHSQYRKLISNAFSLTSLKGYEPCIDDVIRRFMDVCEDHAKTGKPLNLSLWGYYYCYDVVSVLTLGKPLGFMAGNGQDAYSLIESVKAFGKYFMVTSQMPWLHNVFRENPIMRRAKASPFMRVVRERVNERLDTEKEVLTDIEESRLDLLSHFIAAHKTQPLMTRDNVSITSSTNLVAGGLSPGSTADCLFRFLACHPEAQGELYAELSKACLGVPAPFDDIKDLPYLEGVVREALRLHGSASLGLQRIAGPDGLELPGGVRLPANTMVSCSVDAINFDPRLWGHDAKVYDPHRWMKRKGEDEEAHEEKRRRYARADLTFGHGSRGCIGKSIAMLEIFKVVASLMSTFQFELVEETKRDKVLVHVTKRMVLA